MPPKTGRRGVLMTATARKPRAAWRDEPVADDSEEEDDDDDASDASDAEALGAKASQLEWDQIAREVRQEQRKLYAEQNFSSGRRDEGVAAYDDVAPAFEETARAPARPPDGDVGDDDDDDDDDAAAASAVAHVGGAAFDAPSSGGPAPLVLAFSACGCTQERLAKRASTKSLRSARPAALTPAHFSSARSRAAGRAMSSDLQLDSRTPGLERTANSNS